MEKTGWAGYDSRFGFFFVNKQLTVCLTSVGSDYFSVIQRAIHSFIDIDDRKQK